MKKDLRKTKIVGTIGPASENRLDELFKAGLNVTRINYSHGSWDEQSEKTETILKLREELDIPVALLLDMQGPEIRTGMLVTGKNEKIMLEDGQKFTLVNEDIVGDKDKVSVTYKNLYKDIKVGAKVLIDDGAIELVVDAIEGKDIVCTVVHGNGLGSRKTINLPGTPVRLPALKDKDIADLKTACEHNYDYVAMSFTRNKDDIDQVRKVLDENGGKDIKIVTKVENVEGLEHMEEIVENADVQMIARGDMATETDFTEPPVMQKRFIKLSNKAGKPAITATQMLESMTHNPLPTRAEASDVANAIYDRTSAVMLSGECAMGKYPVECVKTMVKIANRVEPEIDYWKRFRNNDNYELDNLEMKIAYSSCVMAMNMESDAIVCYTHTGDSARRIAGLGAGCPILAITDNRRTFNQLAIAWNVTPVFVEKQETIDKTVEAGLKKLQDEYQNLVHVVREEVKAELKEARSLGDLSENADYDAARDKQAQVESRISELENMLSHIEIIDTKKSGSKTVQIGSTVEIEFLDTQETSTYSIVGSTEADPLNGKLSNETPLAQAILNKKVGATVTVNVKKPYKVIIVKVK